MKSFGLFCYLSLALPLLFTGCDNAPASPSRSSETSDSRRERTRETTPPRSRSPQSGGETGRSGASAGNSDAPKPPPSAKGNNAHGANGPDAHGESGSKSGSRGGSPSDSRGNGGNSGSGRRAGTSHASEPGNDTGGGRRSGGSDTGEGKASAGGASNGDRVPAGWLSTTVKQPPSATNQEIWDNIIAAIKPLIVAQQVEFAPLGSANTSLSELQKNRYKAVGRCIVSEKNGARSPFDFECDVAANQYEATIISIDFHSPVRQ